MKIRVISWLVLGMLLNLSSLKAQVSRSVFQLEHLDLFGIYPDTLSDKAIEDLALGKMDSILFAETDSHFVSYPHIYYRYSFLDLPCIKMFGIWSNTATGSEYNPYKEVIFNKCDSTAYHFGGDLTSFSKTIKGYLQTHFDSTSVVNILTLFLNTNSRKSAYYVLHSPDDFERYYNDWYRGIDSSSQYYREKRKKDIAVAEKCVKISKIQKKGTEFDANVYTFNAGRGRIEFWHFIVSKNEIKLKDSEILAKDLRLVVPID